MDKKQGFFTSLKEELVRGLSPSRSRANPSPVRTGSPMSGFLRRKTQKPNGYDKNGSFLVNSDSALVERSGSMRVLGEALAPLMEGPDPDGAHPDPRRVGSGLGQWMRGQFLRVPSSSVGASGSSLGCSKRNDFRLLLGVMGAPLAPIHVNASDPLPHLSIKDTPIVS